MEHKERADQLQSLNNFNSIAHKGMWRANNGELQGMYKAVLSKAFCSSHKRVLLFLVLEVVRCRTCFHISPQIE